MRIKTTAPGKLILLGEYAVLEGAPALVMAVNHFAEVTLQTISSNQSILTAQEIGISALPFSFDEGGKVTFGKTTSNQMLKKLSFFTTALETAYSSFKEDFSSFASVRIILDTSQFFTAQNEKLGLGSSAALTVALFSALSKFQDNNFDIEKEHDVIFKTSLEIHRKAQDSVGSGIDITASVFGGVLRYHITDRENKTLPIYEKLTIPDDLHILSIWTGASASTAQFVQKVNEFKMIKPYDYEAITERMKQVSTSGIEAIQQNSLTEFLKSVRLYYDEMKTLGEKSGVPIVSKAHHHIHDLVMGEGGAYKPSGAGGGDIGTAFCSAATIKEKIAQKLIQNGFHAIDLELVKKGVQLRNF